MTAAPGAGAALPNAAGVDAALARVLTRPEFQAPRETALDHLSRWLGEQVRLAIRWLWSQIGPLHGAFGTPWVADVVLVVLAVALAAVAVRQLRRRRRGPGGAAHRSPSPGSEPDEAGAYLRAAAAAARAGDFLPAAHALYRGVVLSLDAAGALRADDSATGAEYARALRGGPHEAGFAALLHAFYPVAYGGRPDAAGAYGRMCEAAAALGVRA